MSSTQSPEAEEDVFTPGDQPSPTAGDEKGAVYNWSTASAVAAAAAVASVKTKTSPSTSVQKSRTKQPPNTLPNLNKVEIKSTVIASEAHPTTGKSPKVDKTPTPGGGVRPKHLHRRSRTSESESSKTSSSVDGRGKESEEGSKATTPKKVVMRSRKERSADSSRKTTPKTPRKSPKPFEPYISLEEVQRGLKKGELIEGILRINPKNYEDAYISAPDGQMDIYIGGVLDRNRALHGDVVIVHLKPQHDWKVLSENFKCCLSSSFSNNTSIPDSHDTVENFGVGSKKSKRGKRCRRKKRINKSPVSLSEENAVSDSATHEIYVEHEGMILQPLNSLEEILNRKAPYYIEEKAVSDKSATHEIYFEHEGMFLQPMQSIEGHINSKALNDIDEEIDDDGETNAGATVVAPHELSETEDSLKDDASVCSDDLDRVVEMMSFLHHNCSNELADVQNDRETFSPPVNNNSWIETNNVEIVDPILNSIVINAIDYKLNSEISPEKNSRGEDDSHGSKVKVSISEALKHPLAHKIVQKTAKVVYLKERKHNLVAVGHLKLMQDKNPNWALFSPQDHRIPRITIPMKECPPGFNTYPDEFSKILYIAKITEWENSGFAKGHLCRSIGEAGLLDTETEAILVSNNVDFSDFPDDILENIPERLPWTIPEAELRYRRDLRKECIFTIDPPTARDLDDALSCRKLSDGTLEIGVHIADVSYFVPEGSKVDQVASTRATSVYLVQSVVPMLPPMLCEQLCSLNPGEDRLAMSVMWKFTEVGDILDEWFGRTVISSCAKLSYDHVQKIIDDPDYDWKPGEQPQIYGDFQLSEIIAKARQLHEIAVLLRKQRFEGGALSLNQVKLQFEINLDSGLPMGFSVFEQKDSNRLVEEFMLLANMAVAHKILKYFPGKAVLRCHPPPQQHMMEEILETFSTVGLFVDTSSAGKIQDSLTSFKRDMSHMSQARQMAIVNMLSKPMQRAMYFCAGTVDNEERYHHYALNVPLYTHFTSPIRRYADVLVHRMLSSALDYTPEPQANKRILQQYCDHCNDKKYAAKVVQELSQDLYLGAFIKKEGSREEVGIVTAVLDHSFDVLILQFGIIKRVYCNQLPLYAKVYQRQHGIPHLILTWQSDDKNPTSAQTITLFSIVTVLLKPSNEPLKINAILKRPQNSQSFPSNFAVPNI